MIEIEKFREQGYLYDSLENYNNLLDFECFKKIKELIDSKNLIRHSRFDYWYKYDSMSYMEQIYYDTFLKNDKNLNTADYVFEKAHEYQLKKIEECEFYPTWVFGTCMNSDVDMIIRNGDIKSFQEKFSEHYYADKPTEKYLHDFRLQFYNKGCEIKLHDDGAPVNRYCVFLYFLNTEWNDENGGHLILYDKNNEKIIINPVFPNFVVLDSDVNLFHEVEKVKNDIKYNIVSFFGKE